MDGHATTAIRRRGGMRRAGVAGEIGQSDVRCPVTPRVWLSIERGAAGIRVAWSWHARCI